jgi:hypothetical protein
VEYEYILTILLLKYISPSVSREIEILFEEDNKRLLPIKSLVIFNLKALIGTFPINTF